MKMAKNRIGEIKISKSYLSELLGKPVSGFSLDSIDSASPYSDFYKLDVQINSEDELKLMVKDVIDGEVKNISGEPVKSPGQEIEVLEFGMAHKGFRTPRLFGIDEYEGEERNRKLIYMKRFSKSLEKKLLELKESGREDAENVAFNFARRLIDVSLINSELALRYDYPTKGAMGELIGSDITRNKLEVDLNQAVLGLILYYHLRDKDILDDILTLDYFKRIDQFKEIVGWHKDQDLLRVTRVLHDSIAGTLTEIPNGEKRPADFVITNLDPHPDNVFIDENKLSEEYDLDSIFDEERVDDMVIGDNASFGWGPLATKSGYIYHPPFYNILSQGKMQEVAEHTAVQYERFLLGNEKIKGLGDIIPSRRASFMKKWRAGARLELCRGLGFMSWSNLRYPDNAQSLSEKNSLYEPKYFINSMIDCFIGIEDPDKEYIEVNKMLERLKIVS